MESTWDLKSCGTAPTTKALKGQPSQRLPVQSGDLHRLYSSKQFGVQAMRSSVTIFHNLEPITLKRHSPNFLKGAQNKRQFFCMLSGSRKLGPFAELLFIAGPRLPPIPKAPCSLIVHTWALKGLPCHNFGVFVYTIKLQGALGKNVDRGSCARAAAAPEIWPTLGVLHKIARYRS